MLIDEAGREKWASQFSCPVHGQRTYDTVLTTKCCGEVLRNGGFCNEMLLRGPHRGTVAQGKNDAN